MSRFGALFGLKQLLIIILLGALLAAGIGFGSYYFPIEELTARRGTLSFIPLDYREAFVAFRLLAGVAGGLSFILFAGGWLAIEMIARLWQRARNRELGANAVLLRIAPRVDERSKWEAAADLWAAIYSTLALSRRRVWLGAGLHVSLETIPVNEFFLIRQTEQS